MRIMQLWTVCGKPVIEWKMTSAYRDRVWPINKTLLHHRTCHKAKKIFGLRQWRSSAGYSRLRFVAETSKRSVFCHMKIHFRWKYLILLWRARQDSNLQPPA